MVRSSQLNRIWQKEELKLKKNEDKNFHHFMYNSFRLQISVTKTPSLFDHDNVFFILICRVFPQI